MLGLIVIFLIIAIIAAALGFGGIAGTALGFAQVIFYIFLILFIIAIIVALIRGDRRWWWW
ncbi:MAG: DUF1328 domain-containing protein [Proteobacteria bacterium]|nr:DUF1328 domain-containing protein [Pseudomonadota bacterium]